MIKCGVLKLALELTMHKLLNVLLCLAYFALTACGTKGPLYIPEQRYPQKTQAPAEPDSQVNPNKNQ